MTSFVFRLDPVLRYRQYEERAAQLRMVETVRELDQCRRQMAEIDSLGQEAALAFDRQQEEGVTAAWCQIYTLYLLGLRRQSELTMQRACQVERELEEKRQTVRAKNIQRRIMERFKEIQRSAHLEEQGRREQKMADELALTRRVAADRSQG